MMEYDVEFLRDLLFELDSRQTSPRMTVIISVDEAAIALGRSVRDVETGLCDLRALDYIEGPGAAGAPGFFLFRKLTRKGRRFVDMTSRPRDWQTLKDHFARRRAAVGA